MCVSLYTRNQCVMVRSDRDGWLTLDDRRLGSFLEMPPPLALSFTLALAHSLVLSLSDLPSLSLDGRRLGSFLEMPAAMRSTYTVRPLILSRFLA